MEVGKTHSNKELFMRLFPYFKRYKNYLYLDLFAAGMSTCCDLIFPLILRNLMDLARTDVSLVTFSVIRNSALLYLALKIVQLLGDYYKIGVGHMMGARIETDMRHDVFVHLQNLSHSFYSDAKVGSIMSRVTTDLFDVTEFSHHCPEEYFIGALKLIVSFIILVNINLPLTLALYLLIPIMIVSSIKYGKKMRKVQKMQRVHIGDLNSNLEDSLLGIEVVKSFANEEEEIKKFDNNNVEFLRLKKTWYAYMAKFFTITKSFDGIMYLVVIILGGYFLMNGAISSGELVAYILYVSTLLLTVSRIVEYTELFQKGMTGVDRFVEIMDSDVDVFDEENAIELDTIKGKVEFKDVSFSYKDASQTVLDNISFLINPGENIAIVGPSGAGKSTICNLIPRFYDVISGDILIDDINIKNISLKSLRANIGMVQQNVYLFSGSIYDNIVYGKPNASPEEIEKALVYAGAKHFVEELPHGIHTHIGERGVKLSGGQKQRISIARVFLKNPPIIIFDEATSSLDNESERIVQTSIESLAKGRTTITIAHRLSTIKNANRILVLTEDGLVENGSHTELLAKKGAYYTLYNSGFELEKEDE